ncbi:PA14 domain-containing protein [Hippea sp. KM1]|uniref:PA14 domain-containing protein n=1 Tax=Hippea sp. KM1 TaxID=944481 RepID=UPI001E52CED3|nr:PA14 domain-containing protein [Hippea sp. KM1]
MLIRFVLAIFLVVAPVSSKADGLMDIFNKVQKIQKEVNKIKDTFKGEDKQKEEQQEQQQDEGYQEEYNEDENIQQDTHITSHIEQPIFDGEVVIPDSGKTWYFKMQKFSAAACSRVYYSVNGGEPRFLVEFAGLPKDTGAPIPIKGLKEGDRVVFLVKTHYYGWKGPIYSTDSEYFISKKINDRKYYFRFEDAARADGRYNDGAFYFFEEGQMPINRYVRILSYNVYKQGDSYLFRGKIKANVDNIVESKIIIKDNHWKTSDVINLNFSNDSTSDGVYSFSFTMPSADFTKPAYTSILQVAYDRETDVRVRMVKPCVDKLAQQQTHNPFGGVNKDPFVFMGEVFYLKEGTSRLPNFNRLRRAGVVYTSILDITPRRFDEGFDGIGSRYEWFGIRYRGEIFLLKPRLFRFALLSDDGARLYIDGKRIINNDGIHPPRKRYGSVFLDKGSHRIEVDYFQGPRYEVALVLYVKDNGKYRVFDIGDFAPVVRVDDGYGIKKGILFDGDSYRLTPYGVRVLLKMKREVIGKDYSKIVIYGGSDGLSKNRLRSVVNFLEGLGVEARKIETVYSLPEDSEFSIKINYQ